MKYFILTLTILTCLACKRGKNTAHEPGVQCPVQCIAPSAVPYFVGFNADELDSVLLKTFDGNDTGFAHVVHQKWYQHPDTTNVGNRISYPDNIMFLNTGSNYQITVPAAGKVFNLHFHAKASSEMYTCGYSHHCANSVDINTVNGVSVPLEYVYQDYTYAIKLSK
ncbi:MAG: hypothetical protein JST70_18565 [Bacteroidetes bacterium]|nr:hypothetical protein [Bacteroidota bacterium]